MSDITVAALKAWLNQFEEDTTISFEGCNFGPELPKIDLTNDAYQYDYQEGWSYSPASPEWTYNPSEEAASRGNTPMTFPYRPASISLGDEP